MERRDEGFVTLGGIEQWVTVRGDDDTNPVLLVLHGGPGMPYSLFTPRLREWERSFTVVQWDRRGAGRTFRRNGPSGCGPMTFEQQIADAVELRAWLEQRLPGRRVVLLSSSAGTLVGLPLVRRSPQSFAAYVACDFNAGVQSEKAAEPATLAFHRARGRARDVQFLEGLPAPEQRTLADFERLMRLRDRSANGRGVSDVFMPLMKPMMLRQPLDLLAVIRGLGFCTAQLFRELITFDAQREAPRLELPFFVLQGADDVFTPPSAARRYWETVDAREKVFEELAGCGHVGAFAQPERLLEFLSRRVVPAV